MRFPATNKRAMRRVNIPEFTGGINLRDNPTQCGDNQLTELVNMWYKDGILRTRPGIKMIRSQLLSSEGMVDYCRLENKVFNNISRTNNGEMQKLVLCIAKQLDGDNKTQKLIFNFSWCGETTCELIPPFTISSAQELLNYLVYRLNNTIYCFVKTSVNRYIYCSENNNDWRPLSDDDIYVPTVMTNCKTSHALKSTNAWEIENNGVNYEGYNILGNYYKMVYSTVNRNANVSDGNYRMVYGIIENTYDDKYNGFEVKVEYTDKNGNIHKHSVKLKGAIEGWWVTEEKPSTDGLRIKVCSRQIIFVDEKGNEKSLTSDDYIEDNMTIIAPYISPDKDKIFEMSQSEWFGGAATGITGGTRLFLCGSANNKALVMWSGLEQPLYFPEHSCFNVGDTAQAVTGFGKQSNMLVIFKENEVWYTQYQQNTSITGQALVEQAITDMQYSAVYFPLTRISSGIGCPYPDTVQLCRNRLVWLGNDGKIYSLNSENQYNEKNIYPLSEMIDKDLQSKKIINPSSYDWNGYYCLKIGRFLYLMDYNSYGYIYVSSHSKTEDSNARIPWYIWEFDEEKQFLLCDEKLLSFDFQILSQNELRYSIYEFINGISSDDIPNGSAKAVRSVFQTKTFNFGEGNSYKNVYSVGLSLGYNGGGEIHVTLLSDGGNEQTCIVLDDAAEERTVAFTKSKIITPAICQVLRFAIRIECESDVLIDGITIDYRILGRAR